MALEVRLERPKHEGNHRLLGGRSVIPLEPLNRVKIQRLEPRDMDSLIPISFLKLRLVNSSVGTQ